MPTVIGTQEVSGRMPPKSKWYQDVGRITGKTADMLLQAYLTGKYSPSSGQPGAGQQGAQLNFPSGASTPTNPMEMQQINALGGVPTTSGGVMPLQPGGVTYQPPMPSSQAMERMQAFANLQKTAAANDPSSLTNRALQARLGRDEAQAEWLKNAMPLAQGQPQLPKSGGVSYDSPFTFYAQYEGDELLGLYEAAQSDDPELSRDAIELLVGSGQLTEDWLDAFE